MATQALSCTSCCLLTHRSNMARENIHSLNNDSRCLRNCNIWGSGSSVHLYKFPPLLSSPPAVQNHSFDLVRGLAELRYLMQQLFSGSRLPLATHFSPEEFHLIMFRACNSEVSESPRPQVLAKAVGLQRVTALDEDACPTQL